MVRKPILIAFFLGFISAFILQALFKSSLPPSSKISATDLSAGQQPGRVQDQKSPTSKVPVMPEEEALQRKKRRLRYYDRDRDQLISQEEYLASRKRNYMKRDSDKDGILSFEEYAATAIAKFKAGDRDNDRMLTMDELDAMSTKTRSR